jgi:hypothetical protein
MSVQTLETSAETKSSERRDGRESAAAWESIPGSQLAFPCMGIVEKTAAGICG